MSEHKSRNKCKCPYLFRTGRVDKTPSRVVALIFLGPSALSAFIAGVLLPLKRISKDE